MNSSASLTEEQRMDRIHGLLLGCALGDSVGLPAEGLSRARIARWWPGEWRQRFLLGRGMLSDDTEHSLLVAEALIRDRDDVNAFQRHLARRFRWWLLALPAGVGLATGRAIVRLWLGFSPARSGVRSAGNGAAMRSAIVGAVLHDHEGKLLRFARAAAEITHRNERAIHGAIVIARLAAWIMNHAIEARPSTAELEELLLADSPDEEWKQLVKSMTVSFAQGESVDEFVCRIGLEAAVTGYVRHTVPVAVYAWWIHARDVRGGLESVFRCGGDADTVGSIAGSLLGASSGVGGLPDDWIAGLCDWPRSRRFIANMAQAASRIENAAAPSVFWLACALRNTAFLCVVLGHGLRRLLPPY